jgi:hypothetical protein
VKKKRTAVWADLRAEYHISQWDAALLRVVEAAKKGGAAWADIVKVAERADTRLRMLDGLPGRKVTEDERNKVRELDTELRKQHPLKSCRYDAIDAELGFRRGRARYIIEGPRKSKKKK